MGRAGDNEEQLEHSAIRVTLQQPSLAKYRVPVFRELAARPGIRLKVLYADVPGIPNVAPDGFDAQLVPMWQGRLLRHPVYWHRPQWEQATRERADVLILTWDVHYASLVPALLRARAQGVGTVLWGHGYSKADTPARSWPRRKVAELATALLFYNRTTAERFIANGTDPRRVFVAPNSIDQESIRAARRDWLGRRDDLAAFRAAHGLGDGPVVLFVSRFDPANRVDLLLRAAARLTPKFPSLRLVIVGKGEPEGARLRALTDELRIADHVIFHGAVYDEHALATWFLCADLFCYPANIGLSLLHAFGYGLPVVTSDKTEAQNPEIEALRNGVNGLTYRDGDADALAAALARILDDQPLRTRLSAAALASASDEFTVPRMVDGMEQAIRYSVSHQAGSA